MEGVVWCGKGSGVAGRAGACDSVFRGFPPYRHCQIIQKGHDVADPASRNKLKEMRTNAEKHGWVVEKELELADLYQIIPDLEMLFIRLKEITLTMRNDDRSTDKW